MMRRRFAGAFQFSEMLMLLPPYLFCLPRCAPPPRDKPALHAGRHLLSQPRYHRLLFFHACYASPLFTAAMAPCYSERMPQQQRRFQFFADARARHSGAQDVFALFRTGI